MDDEFYFSTSRTGGPGPGVIEGNKRSSLPSLKRTTLPGLIATAAPVRGLRAMPVLRGRTLKIPKPPELDAVATRQSQLHAFEHPIHRHFSFCLCDAGFVYDFVNNVELDQSSLLFPTCQLAHRFVSLP
jgi:hypothetical protein